MLVVCTGTATDIGKTWLGAQVLSAVRAAGISVAARKPAQSFDADDSSPTDAEILAAATGEPVHHVCSDRRSYPVAMAPPMAAEALGQPSPTVEELLAEMVWPSPTPQLRWVETVGGVRSPLASNGDTATLCARLRPSVVVLVADADLGAINSVRLAASALAGHHLIVYLNRFSHRNYLHQANRQWLTERDGYRTAIAPAEVVDLVLELI